MNFRKILEMIHMTIYDVPQLCNLLKLSDKAVRNLCSSGKLQARKVGKRWLVSEEALERFLKGETGSRSNRVNDTKSVSSFY